MKYLFSILLLVAFLFSCGDKDKTKNREFENCLKDEEFETIGANIKCSDFIYDTSGVCEIIDLDTLYSLNDYQKEWLPYYCCTLGEDIYYIDKDKNETSLVILDKSAKNFKIAYYSYHECPEDSSKSIAYCIRAEAANVTLYSELMDTKLEIKLEPYFLNSIKNPGSEIASVEVYSFEKKGDLNIVITHLRAYVGKDSDMIPDYSLSKHFEEIEILGKTFYDVYTYDNPLFPDLIKMYYNSDYGIVSFIDKSGKQWRIKTD